MTERHDASPEKEPVVVRDKRRIHPDGTQPSGAAPAAAAAEPGSAGTQPAEPADTAAHPLGVELEAVRAELDERTKDLQRVTAEYANYRRRVERDRTVAAEKATGSVLTALLPILDDLDRAREHGDLSGPFAAVAEQLTQALTKFGLSGFGEKGDPFDPTRHEAVAHLTSVEVGEPTCIDVLRRGYLIGERLLRPALVAVADPVPAAAEQGEPVEHTGDEVPPAGGTPTGEGDE